MDRMSEGIENSLKLFETFRNEVGHRVLGQREMVDSVLMAILAGGHILLEGVPGLAKTLLVQTVADVANLSFKRIQFTPDLLPADVVGTMMYQSGTGTFVVNKGPVFSNLLLADEINRAPAKVQSALLESMEEKQVTLGDTTYRLPKPFFVLATQNPIEHEGTYSLPEAQQDRFLMKVKVGYPKLQEELQLLKNFSLEGNFRDVRVGKVLDSAMIFNLQELLKEIRVDERIMTYIVSFVAATREKDSKTYPFARYIEFGASPRASLALLQCARVQALFEGRAFVLPEDVKTVALRVLRHRIVLSYEAEVEELSVDDVIKIILSAVAVP
jgi:MoxR-like ATPase